MQKSTNAGSLSERKKSTLTKDRSNAGKSTTASLAKKKPTVPKLPTQGVLDKSPLR